MKLKNEQTNRDRIALQMSSWQLLEIHQFWSCQFPLNWHSVLEFTSTTRDPNNALRKSTDAYEQARDNVAKIHVLKEACGNLQIQHPWFSVNLVENCTYLFSNLLLSFMNVLSIYPSCFSNCTIPFVFLNKKTCRFLRFLDSYDTKFRQKWTQKSHPPRHRGLQIIGP